MNQLFEQHARIDLQREGKLLDDDDRRRALSALDPAHIGSVNADHIRELVL